MHRAAAVALFLVAASAHAHPGHGIAELWHLLTEPDHLAMILLPAGIAAGILVARRRAQARRVRRRGRQSRRTIS
jgi:hydrogenase/urease accessory protein HupE